MFFLVTIYASYCLWSIWVDSWFIFKMPFFDRSIEIRKAGTLQLMCQILVHKKLIQCLSWHPMYTAVTGGTKSLHHNWLATSSNENDIHVFDLADVLGRTNLYNMSLHFYLFKYFDSYFVQKIRFLISCRYKL